MYNTPVAIKNMRHVGKIAAKILQLVLSEAKAGTSTKYLDNLVKHHCLKMNVQSSCWNYRGYPAQCCISVNEVGCHGIPSEQQILQSGDIVNIDIAVNCNNYHADCAKTIIIGQPASQEDVLLVQAAQQALFAAIKVIKPGCTLYDIALACESTANQCGYHICKGGFCGHGIGMNLHEKPDVWSYIPNNKRQQNFLKNYQLALGQTFTIEPIVSKHPTALVVLADNWTAVSPEGYNTAHWEHTLLVVNGGVEILTSLESSI